MNESVAKVFVEQPLASPGSANKADNLKVILLQKVLLHNFDAMSNFNFLITF